jgi:hypothetical protein
MLELVHMNYPDSFFNLQLDYANRVSEVAGISFEEALLQHTGFYKLIGTSDWDFNKNNPQWQELASQINSNPNIDIIKKFCIYGRTEDVENDKKFGCFSYDFNEKTGNVHLHFMPSIEKGSLSFHQKDQRLQELQQIFLSVQKKISPSEKCSRFFLVV